MKQVVDDRPAIHGVLFDCDGVLVDSELISRKVLVELASEIGFSLDLDVTVERFMGRRLADGLAEIETQTGRQLPGDFMEILRAREYEALAGQVTMIPGADEFIESLGCPFCVASNGPLEKIRCTLGATGLLELFGDRLFSAYELDMFKPEPDLYLHAAKALGVDVSECVVMEDSVPGVRAGLSAGARVIAYTPDVDRALYPQSDRLYFIDSMTEATQLVREFNSQQ